MQKQWYGFSVSTWTGFSASIGGSPSTSKRIPDGEHANLTTPRKPFKGGAAGPNFLPLSWNARVRLEPVPQRSRNTGALRLCRARSRACL